MSPRWLLCLYPPAWRRRYEDEVTALLEERPLSPFIAVDLVFGALDARLRPQISSDMDPGSPRGWIPRTLPSALLLTAVSALTLAATQRAGPNMTEFAVHQGTFTKEGEQYAIDGTEVSFGPAWYVVAVDAEADYDRDGTVEAIAAELDGLVGTTVAIGMEEGSKGDADVFTINGEMYRSDGRPPWAGGPYAHRSLR